MKWNLWNARRTSLLLVAVACLVGGGAQAAEPRNPEARRLPRILAALDADNDGTLSDTELERAGKVLKDLDQNGDGRIAADEFRHGREGRRPSDAKESDRPQLRRQGRPEAGESAERPEQGGRRQRNRDDGQVVGRERGPSGDRSDAQATDRPAREHRREGLRRQGGDDRSGAEMRRNEGGPGPKRGERSDGDVKRGDRRGESRALARRHDDRRDGQGERCPACGRPLPPGHRESGVSERRGPGGRG